MTVAGAHDYEEVFRDVFPRLVSLGVLKTGRVDSARDLAQETMLRAHTRWDELATYDAPAAWCHTVMTNLLVDHHRSATSSSALSNASAGAAKSRPIETTTPPQPLRSIGGTRLWRRSLIVNAWWSRCITPTTSRSARSQTCWGPVAVG